MTKNILITGGAGFIGSNLALSLVSRGYQVTILDNLTGQVHGADPYNTSLTYRLIIDKVKFIKGSVTSRKDVEMAVEGIDTIIHLAAETGTGQSMYRVKHYVDTNIGGTVLLLDVLAKKKHTVKKIIMASSRAIYGEGKYFSEGNGFVYPEHRRDENMRHGDFEVHYPGCTKLLKAVATDEEAKVHPSSVYGITKQNQEQLVMTVCPTIGIVPVVFRYHNVYGPGQSLNNPYTGILSIFSTLIKGDNGINIFEDGRSSRDFIYIDDVIDATILGIENAAADGETFNVGTGIGIEILTVVTALMENYNKEVPVNILGNYRLGDIRHNFSDTAKVNKLLGFTPKISFNEGISRFTQWVNAQEIVGNKYQQSLLELKKRGLFI